MGTIKIRYLVARQRSRRPTRYYWVPTKKLQDAGFLIRRLPDAPDEAVRTAEALNAELDRWYRGEAGAAPAARTGSLRALDDLFQRDESFRQLAERSKRDYLYTIRPALDWAGDEPVAGIQLRAIKAWQRMLVETKGVANARNAIAALRRLLSFGREEGWIAENPALRLRVRQPESRSRVWTAAEVETFCTAATQAGRPSLALAVMLGWCLGQRPADLRTLAWTAYEAGSQPTMAIRQAKTGKLVLVPVLPELQLLLDATPRLSTQIVVSEITGRPYRESDFQHSFARVRSAAALPEDLQFRDLRRSVATALGAAGCTDDQIRAITGHVTREVVAVYVRPDTTFARAAMDRLRLARGNGS